MSMALKRSLLTMLSVVYMEVLQAGTVVGSGPVSETVRELGAFNSVSVASGIHARIVIENKSRITVRSYTSIIELVETDVKGSHLLVRLKPGTNVRVEQPIEVTISTPTLTAVNGSGGSKIQATVPAGDVFEVHASGASQLDLESLNSARVTAQASGASSIKLSGATKALEANTSGASTIDAQNLSAAKAEVNGSGASTIRMKKVPSVSGGLSGGSNLQVSKAAKVEVALSGGSHVLRDD